MLWWSLGPHIEQRVNQETEQRWGWVVFPPPEEKYPGFINSLTLGAEYMPRTGITNETALEVHGNLNIIYPGIHKRYGDGESSIFSMSYGGVEIRFWSVWRDVASRVALIAGIHSEYDQLVTPLSLTWTSGYMSPAELDAYDSINWGYSFKASSSYIDADRHIEGWRGSTTGPTHTVESRFSDSWEPLEPISFTITFGPLSVTIDADWAAQIYEESEDEFFAPDGNWQNLIPTPASSPSIWHDAVYGSHVDLAYSGWKKFANWTVNSATVPWDFSAIEDYYKPLGYGGLHAIIGNGNALEFWADGNGLSSSHAANGGRLAVPRILDLTERGLTTWGKTSPDDNRYGDVLLWLWDGYATCPEWQLGNHGDPMNVLPTWYGPEWDGDAGEWIEMRNPLDGICPYCGSRMRPQGMNKVPWLDGWPYAEQTDWIPDPEDPEAKTEFADGTAAPLTQSQLHAVFKPYAQRLAPYAAWDKKAEYVSDDYELWWGASALLVDRKSGIANTLPTSITQAAVPVIPLHVEDLTATDRVSSPFFNVADANTEVDVDLGPAGERVSAWESTDFTVINGGIGTTLPVAWTVGAGGGTLERGPLINPYWERNADLIANEQAGAYPYAYMYRKAGASPPGLADYVWPGGWDDRDCMGG
ncbi:MAG: hypothetical protein WC145_12235, partial [Aliarcobacter sp.]